VPVAVVTGGARGIGAAIAHTLAARGLEVVRLDREPGPGVVECDVADRARVEEVAAEVGPVAVLVNNAGQWRFGPLEDVTPADWDAVMATNLGGTFHCTQAFGRSMLAAGRGAIVNVVSIAAAAANPMVGAYSASKAAVLALTRQTALEWGPRGIRANAVGPGLVPTPGTGTVYDDPGVRAVRAGAVPLRRLAEPQDVANVVAFLASDEASYVNGQVLYVDGGLSQALMTLLPRPAGVAGPSLTSTTTVVHRHLRAVERLDLTGMSADYALDATLDRGPDRYAGREAIAGYFAGVPARLGGRSVRFGDLRAEPDGSVVVPWQIEGAASGHDRFVVRDGWIVAQSVHLDGTDF
jgi:NAD(P)-dependent dehydrogenase (short-subunit alcohol dehydrogenase family)